MSTKIIEIKSQAAFGLKLNLRWTLKQRGEITARSYCAACPAAREARQSVRGGELDTPRSWLSGVSRFVEKPSIVLGGGASKEPGSYVRYSLTAHYVRVQIDPAGASPGKTSGWQV
jgi:hypothetical protein